MDWWSEWVTIRDRSFPSCYFECESKRNFSYYVANERACALNQEACDQARRILLRKDHAVIIKLEDDVTTLENQLVWADLSWSEIGSDIPLSERVKSLDLSIKSLKNTYPEDDQNISSLLYRDLVERWQTVLKRLPEKYLPQNAIQANDLIIKELVVATPQSKTDLITGKINVSCSTPETVRRKDEVQEIIKSNIGESVLADKHETSITVKKSDISWSMPKTIKEVERSNDVIVKELVSADPQHETEKSLGCSVLESTRKEEEVKQRDCSKIGEAISDAPVHVTDDPRELKEPLVSLRSPSKESSFVVWTPSLKLTGKGSCLPGTTKPASDLTSDAIKYKIGSEVKIELSEVGSNEDGLNDTKSHSFADESISLTAALWNREKETKFSENVKFVGHTSEYVSRDLHRASEGTGKDEEVSKCTKDDLTGKVKTDTQGNQVPGGSLSDREINKSDKLLEFYNRKREQFSMLNSKEGERKKAKIFHSKCEPLSDLILKSLKPKPKPSKIFKQKPKVEYDLYEQSVGSASKRQLETNSQNWPGIEKDKKLKSLESDHILALTANSTESLSAESVCSNNLAIVGAPMKKTPRVLPSVWLPSALLGRADLEKLKLTKLRDIAKQIGIKGYSKFPKSKLIEEIESKLVTEDK